MESSTPAVSSSGDELKYLVYTSVATRRPDLIDLESLLMEAREANSRSSVTGLLLYRKCAFIQFIEGPPTEIDSPMESIRKDDRHENVSVVLEESVTARRFIDWRMGYREVEVNDPPIFETITAHYSDHGDEEASEIIRHAAEDFSLWFKETARA